MKRHSILRRALGAVLLIECLAAALLLLSTAAHEQHTRSRAFDDRLDGRAAVLLGAVGDADDPGDNVMLDPRGIEVPAGDLYQVVEQNAGAAGADHVLGRSPNWSGPSSPGEAAAALLASSAEGRVTVQSRGRFYRFVGLRGTRVVDPGENGGGKAHRIAVIYGAPTRYLRHQIWSAIRFYALTTVAVLLLTTTVLVTLLRRALAPLGELARAAGGISEESWSFSPPPSALAAEELAPLSDAILASVHRLQQSFERQRRFSSDAAHELKTDVAIVKSSLQLLLLRPRPAEEYVGGIAVSLSDCDRMEATVQQMLTLARSSRSEDGFAEPKETCDLRLRARESLRALAPMAELHGVQLELEQEGASAWVPLPARDCDLLCLNLLENAVQHSKRGGRVVVSVETGAVVSMEVRDQGDGVHPAALPHVFEPFYRADDARDRRGGGTGLGLAICKAICRRAGGSIEMQSEPGRGTVVRVRLPATVQV